MTSNKPIKQPQAGQQTLSVWLVNAGLIAIAVATLLPILRMGAPVFPWLYAAGALLTIAGRLMSLGAYKGLSLRVRRLGRMELWASVMFAVAAFFIFYDYPRSMDWLAFTLAGAALQTYASIAIPRALRKEGKPGK